MASTLRFQLQMLWALALVLCYRVFHIMPPCEDDKKGIGPSAGYNIASEILTKSINFSVDPCEDFFAFTCGNWIANHPIPKHQTIYHQFAMVSDRVQEQMRDILESNETLDSKSMNALKAIYKKCMDKEELNRIGASRLIEDIRNFGFWPLLEGEEEWRNENFDLTSLLMHVSKKRNVNAFLKYSITPDDKNVSRCLIKFDQGNLILGESSRDYYLDKKKHGKKIEALKNLLISQIELCQADAYLPTNRSKTVKDIDELIDLETKLARIIVAEEDRRNHTKLYNLRHLSDMQRLMPLVDWAQFFLAIAPTASHQYLNSDPEILIVEIDYLRRITDLLQSTDKRIIMNYVLMLYFLDWTREMGEKYEDVTQEFNKVMYGKQQKAPRWKDCITHTMELEEMQYATSAIYIKKDFDQESKNVTLEMIDDLQKAFREILSSSDWMDDQTKTTALDKENRMLPQIAYPDFILDDEKLDAYYDGLDVRDTDSYTEMLEKVTRWGIEYAFKGLMKPVNRSEYNFNSAIVNAYYSMESNSIKFPAAILQAPFFHHTFPRALNYGGIGAVIGHEITHGFDDEGRQFDAIGNLREWWSEGIEKKFQDRTQCIISQYGNINVPGTGLKINGRLTQGENIADNGGVKQAYKAYEAYLQKHGEEERIEGLEQYNNKQMFFLGYAMTWCGHMTDDELIKRILIDVHAPPRYRVNQVLANQPEFAAAFRCKKGAAMNPRKRCAVW
ncbi:unnamed protein product [Cylicocyclus nassatus]|uniref:Uncharacterized protein n=1 Tax=Cylicocyclus nassatus TaxID=53992 RepID=A0AA36DNW8_CYLNA|nr:unnamed protein product [Cylicocyclus nassatus]